MQRDPRMAMAVLALTALVTAGLAAQEDAPAPDAGSSAEAQEAPVKQIKMYAENWKWIPNTIRVTQGTRVQIRFESRDASHAFELKAYGIKVPLPQDSKAEVEFLADRAGEFRWVCGRPCGDGCPKMRGKLIVEPAGD